MKSVAARKVRHPLEGARLARDFPGEWVSLRWNGGNFLWKTRVLSEKFLAWFEVRPNFSGAIGEGPTGYYWELKVALREEDAPPKYYRNGYAGAFEGAKESLLSDWRGFVFALRIRSNHGSGK